MRSSTRLSSQCHRLSDHLCPPAAVVGYGLCQGKAFTCPVDYIINPVLLSTSPSATRDGTSEYTPTPFVYLSFTHQGRYLGVQSLGVHLIWFSYHAYKVSIPSLLSANPHTSFLLSAIVVCVEDWFNTYLDYLQNVSWYINVWFMLMHVDITIGYMTIFA